MSDKRIFDCFIFFNELDLLDIRLEECCEFVDYFVICEATLTFRGAPKPLVFADNRDRFKKYLGKIRHIVVDDLPMDTDAWGREHFQRNALRRGIQDAEPEDVVIVSDCDEIIRPRALDYLRRSRGYFMLDMAMYQFHLNMMCLSAGWTKVFAFSYAVQDRLPDFNQGRMRPEQVFQDFAGINHRVRAAGWHFTYLGGAARVVEKIQAYSHDESWQRRMLEPGGADLQMLSLKDVGGGRFLEYADIDASFPNAVRRRQEELTKMGLIKEEGARISDLQAAVAKLDYDNEKRQGRIRYLETELERLLSRHDVETNIALGKPATQSSISRWSHGKTKEEDAAGGNDGLITDRYGFHTDFEDNPWWAVDLESICLVNAIRIFNWRDNTVRLRHFSILSSKDGATWAILHRKSDDSVFGSKLEPYDVHFGVGVEARYVKIQLDGYGVLHLSECLIFGRLAEPKESERIPAEDSQQGASDTS